MNKFWLMLNFAICLTTWKWLTCTFYEMIQVFFTPSPWTSYITYLLPKQQIFYLVNEYETLGSSRELQRTPNLGVGFDHSMSMKFQVQSICQSGYYHLRNIYRIKNCLTREALGTLVHSVVSSRLDYCNALLAGLPAYLVARLQIVQNCAARLITGVKRRAYYPSSTFSPLAAS